MKHRSRAQARADHPTARAQGGMAMNDDTRCSATILVKDDRWGGWTDRCEGDPGHEGPHFIAMNACEPRALKIWNDDPVEHVHG